jgi:hypothetical protein
MRHLANASIHLQRHDEERVLDAIDELDIDIARIRSLMHLTQEFNQSKEKYV